MAALLRFVGYDSYIKKQRRRCSDVNSGAYAVFYTVWSHIRICDRSAGIYESSGIPGGGDHAACGNMVGERSDQFSDGHADVGSGGAAWKLDLIFPGKAWRRCFFPFLCQEISEAEGIDREESGSAAKKRSRGSIRGEAGADDTDADLDPGGNDLHGVWQIYGKLCLRGTCLEHGIYRSRICDGGCGMEYVHRMGITDHKF